MIVTAVPLQHTKRLTVTRMVLWDRQATSRKKNYYYAIHGSRRDQEEGGGAGPSS